MSPSSFMKLLIIKDIFPWNGNQEYFKDEWFECFLIQRLSSRIVWKGSQKWWGSHYFIKPDWVKDFQNYWLNIESSWRVILKINSFSFKCVHHDFHFTMTMTWQYFPDRIQMLLVQPNSSIGVGAVQDSKTRENEAGSHVCCVRATWKNWHV